MKKIVFLSLIIVLSTMSARAQFGSLIQKAAAKTAKAIEKTADSVANAATSALDKQFEKRQQQSQQNAETTDASASEELTYLSLMQKLPELPTVQQLYTHKEAELNEQTLRLLTSAVSRFNTQVLNLSMKVLSIATQNLDSAEVVDGAYRWAELSTGMTKEELEHLASLPEDQQDAYIAAHYKTGTAESALMQQAADAGKYLEPLQPVIDKWEEAGRKADKVLEQADAKCKKVYQKYFPTLKNANGKERNQILLKYYNDILPIQRDAVQKAMKIRLEEQLPIAEDIEQKMVKIRAEHKDMISALLNYPQLTASQYFNEVARLLDIPEYTE